MPDSNSKPKLRLFQFSQRKFVLLLTLCTVLAVAGWQYREWGRALSEKSQAMSVEQMYTCRVLHQLEALFVGIKLSVDFPRRV